MESCRLNWDQKSRAVTHCQSKEEKSRTQVLKNNFSRIICVYMWKMPKGLPLRYWPAQPQQEVCLISLVQSIVLQDGRRPTTTIYVSLKSLLSGFTYAQNVPFKLWGEYRIYFLKKSTTHNKFWVFFVEIASKLANFSLNFSSFNLFPFLPSVATTDKKQDKRHNIVIFGIRLRARHLSDFKKWC